MWSFQERLFLYRSSKIHCNCPKLYWRLLLHCIESYIEPTQCTSNRPQWSSSKRNKVVQTTQPIQLGFNIFSIMWGGNLKKSRVYQRGCNMNFEFERSINGDEICLVVFSECPPPWGFSLHWYYIDCGTQILLISHFTGTATKC